jgi:hypothetical protein
MVRDGTARLLTMRINWRVLSPKCEMQRLYRARRSHQ